MSECPWHRHMCSPQPASISANFGLRVSGAGMEDQTDVLVSEEKQSDPEPKSKDLKLQNLRAWDCERSKVQQQSEHNSVVPVGGSCCKTCANSTTKRSHTQSTYVTHNFSLSELVRAIAAPSRHQPKRPPYIQLKDYRTECSPKFKLDPTNKKAKALWGSTDPGRSDARSCSRRLCHRASPPRVCM